MTDDDTQYEWELIDKLEAERDALLEELRQERASYEAQAARDRLAIEELRAEVRRLRAVLKEVGADVS